MEPQVLNAILTSVPTMLVVMIGILLNNSRLSELRRGLNGRISELRLQMDMRFDNVDRRFDEMKDHWRSELHRVEEVLDARFKHLEER